MTIRDLLAASGLAHVDAEVLLAHTLQKDRSWLMAHDADEVPMLCAFLFEEFTRQRKAGEPIAYIIGHKEFYGRTFSVRQGVLVPRPCTEALVTTAMEILDGKIAKDVREIDPGIVCVTKTFGECADLGTIVDVGTGSGCIALTLACERPTLHCIAIDTSKEALDIAAENAKELGVNTRVNFLRGKSLEPLESFNEPFLLVTNPPYVSDPSLLAHDVAMYEPHEALFGGGVDGGEILREIVRQARGHPQCRGIVAECLSEQASIVTGS